MARNRGEGQQLLPGTLRWRFVTAVPGAVPGFAQKDRPIYLELLTQNTSFQ